MRTMLMMAAAAALVAGCAANEPRRTDASLPTVTYDYDSDGELREAARRAEDYCGENYDRDARLAEPLGDRGEATFVCVDD